MSRWSHEDGPATYAEVGTGAPEPYTGEPTWLPGQLDLLDELPADGHVEPDPCRCRSLFCDWCGDEAYTPGRPPRENTP